jgi:hypothetical protein
VERRSTNAWVFAGYALPMEAPSPKPTEAELREELARLMARSDELLEEQSSVNGRMEAVIGMLNAGRKTVPLQE